MDVDKSAEQSIQIEEVKSIPMDTFNKMSSDKGTSAAPTPKMVDSSKPRVTPQPQGCNSIDILGKSLTCP